VRQPGFPRPCISWTARLSRRSTASRNLEDGVVDFGQVFEALDHVGYDGWLVMEDFSGVCPSKEALRYNLEFVRSFVESS
jgi:sugar phosphate isomerase/epimerase